MPSVPDAAIVPVASSHVVLALQHDRQRHQADHHHRGADDAGGRSQDGAHHRDRERESPRRPPQQDLEAVEQVGGDAGSFQHRAHEDEHRDRHQNQIVGDAPYAERQVEELDRVEDVQGNAEEAEGQSHAAEDEAYGEPREQQDRQRPEHERRQIVLDVEHPAAPGPARSTRAVPSRPCPRRLRLRWRDGVREGRRARRTCAAARRSRRTPGGACRPAGRP